ncbi:MAG: complex I NDUFA9 subunit family protein [Pseudomonadota bacterium]
MRVTIFGGGGFIGRAITHRLLEQGHEVKVISRRPPTMPGDETHHPRPILTQADPHEPQQRREHLRGQDAAINLVGILHGRPADFERAHITLAEGIAADCRAEGVSRLLHMSALHADPEGPSTYLRTKGRGEARVLAHACETLRVTSFRPSVVFGPEDRFLNTFARLLALSPGVMLLPGAHARFAPVYVGDVAEAFAAALGGEDEKSPPAQRIDLCGPHHYTLLELVRQVSTWSGHRRLILPLPDRPARLLATLMETLPRPPLSRDNLDSMRVDSVCAEGACLQPTALEQIAPAYLGRSHPPR